MFLDLDKPVRFRGTDLGCKIEQVIEMSDYLMVIVRHNRYWREGIKIELDGSQRHADRPSVWDLVNAEKHENGVYIDRVQIRKRK